MNGDKKSDWVRKQDGEKSFQFTFKYSSFVGLLTFLPNHNPNLFVLEAIGINQKEWRKKIPPPNNALPGTNITNSTCSTVYVYRYIIKNSWTCWIRVVGIDIYRYIDRCIYIHTYTYMHTHTYFGTYFQKAHINSTFQKAHINSDSYTL